jgi:hypothetical protein
MGTDTIDQIAKGGIVPARFLPARQLSCIDKSLTKEWSGCAPNQRAAVMTDADNLRNQIERAKRFAASVTSENEWIRFEAIASELRRELQLVEVRQSRER